MAPPPGEGEGEEEEEEMQLTDDGDDGYGSSDDDSEYSDKSDDEYEKTQVYGSRSQPATPTALKQQSPGPRAGCGSLGRAGLWLWSACGGVLVWGYRVWTVWGALMLWEVLGALVLLLLVRSDGVRVWGVLGAGLLCVLVVWEVCGVAVLVTLAVWAVCTALGHSCSIVVCTSLGRIYRILFRPRYADLVVVQKEWGKWISTSSSHDDFDHFGACRESTAEVLVYC